MLINQADLDMQQAAAPKSALFRLGAPETTNVEAARSQNADLGGPLSLERVIGL